jgi:ubiquinone/menaquinone biosynthesis C-methylase UbiE
VKNLIEILDPKLLLPKTEIIGLIDYWKRVLNRIIGWHYDLDIIWIMDKIYQAKIPKGSTIVDAGAGNGLLQFILAAEGYNVLSIDFADRDVPFAAKNIFSVSQTHDRTNVKKHSYQKFIDHKGFIMQWEVLQKAIKNPLRALNRIANRTKHFTDPLLWKEFFAKKNYGSIQYQTADFSNLQSIPTGSVACVVSMSSIEHNDFGRIAPAIREFERILPEGGLMLVTTSAVKEKEIYLEGCQGWCFTAPTLKKIFEMEGASDNYNLYDEIFDRLVTNEFIRSRIPQLYFERGDNGLPFGKYPPLYQPVGIAKMIGQQMAH